MPARRWAAVGTAVTVTVLSLSGALGFGPGAAVAEPSKRTVQTQHPRPDDGAGSSHDATSNSASDWLTVEPDKKTDDSPSAADTGAESRTLPVGTGHGKRVVYSEAAQRVWLVGPDGEVARTYLVSGGKDQDLLDPGRYRVYSKSRHAVSYNNKATMNYMVRFTTGDNSPIGFHDLPVHRNGTLAQSRSDLGTPLSSGCIRQWIADARALWMFAPVGTPVVVAD